MMKLETVSIAEPLQNRQHAQSHNAVNTREKGKREGRKEGRWKEGGRKEAGERGERKAGR